MEEPRNTTPTAAPAPEDRGGRPATNAIRDVGEHLAEQLAAKHGGNGRAGGRFVPGGTPWNKGRNLAVDANPGAPAAGPGPGAVEAPVQLVDASAVREMVTLGFQALDETLRQNFAESWFKLTGDRAFADGQADHYGAKPGQVKAVAIFAGLCAEKYQAQIQYLPEIGLAVAVGAYGVNWRIGFNKLHQAAKLKAQAEAKAAEAKAA